MMIKPFTTYCFTLLLSFSLLASCAEKSDTKDKSADEYTTSLVPVPGTASDNDADKTEERAYKPLKWEIKWASKQVYDFDSNNNKVCKTEFTNPYDKSIKKIKVGYEVKYKNRSNPVSYEKVILLNLRPNEKKIIDTGIGCRDFYMFEVIFEDGEAI